MRKKGGVAAALRLRSWLADLGQGGSGYWSRLEPRMLGQPFGFEAAYQVGLLQSQADFIKTVNQAMLAEWLDIECQFAIVRCNDHLAFEVDTQFVANKGLRFIEQPRHLQLGQDDRQQTILIAVVEENVGVAGRNDGAKAILRQCPGCVLAAGTATEVLARQQDGCLLIARLVQ